MSRQEEYDAIMAEAMENFDIVEAMKTYQMVQQEYVHALEAMNNRPEIITSNTTAHVPQYILTAQEQYELGKGEIWCSVSTETLDEFRKANA
ncbi:hypothetical protein LCGC14_0386890 [marine sediment metagenome]|uniref:Uncharacterized protein n=1 Tax=marine sediment metagenome TaxID=412755 RepID=A0A0F9VMW8_9ZZZZ